METNERQPRTLLEAIRYFSDADRALAFVVQLRWPTGEPVCPRCGCLDHSFISTRRIWKCKGCRKQFSVKVGTIFEDSPIGFDKWLPAMWLICNSKNSISSYELSRSLGVTQKTAWFMLHRIRVAMETKTFERLSGHVEMDETYVGGKPRNSDKAEFGKSPGGRQSAAVKWARDKKVPVFGMVERNNHILRDGKTRPEITRHGQIVAHVVPKNLQQSVVGHIKTSVDGDTVVYTDDARIYDRLESDGFTHHKINHSEGVFVDDHIHTQTIEGFWSLFKRALRGTQTHMALKHLERYVTERVFAYNHRDRTDLERMQTTLGTVAGRRLTYAQLKSH